MDKVLQVLFFCVSLYSRMEYIQCKESAGPNVFIKQDKPVIEFSNSSINASSGEVVLNAGTYGFGRLLRKGDSLNITCYSSQISHWVVVQGRYISGVNYNQTYGFKEIDITESKEGYLYQSNLYIDNIKYNYTGLYVCRLEEDINVNNSIFIFAKDLERPFTDSYYRDSLVYGNVLTLYKDKHFRVPCQTSFPDINVTFRHFCQNSKSLGPEHGVVFDPKKGVLIEKVDDSFGGMYVCETKINNVTYSRTFTFLLADYLIGDILHLYTEKDTITVRENEDKSANFVIFVKAFLEPQFYWKKDGRNITKQDTNIEWQHMERNQINLRVKYPKREDAGTYTIMASIADLDKSLDVHLIVEYIPEVNLLSNNNGSKYYLTGLEHKINCSVKSVPFPTKIDWFEQTCESPINCNIQNDKWKPANVTEVTSSVHQKQVSFKLDNRQTIISQVIVRNTSVESFKYYKCVGQNKVGSNSALFPYVATDVKDGFHKWVLNRYPVVGETVKLYFKASTWKFSNLTVMNRSHVNQVNPGWTVNRTNITHIRKKQSVMTVVTISPVTIYDYNFVSFAYDIHGRKIDRPVGELHLTVRDRNERNLLDFLMSPEEMITVRENKDKGASIIVLAGTGSPNTKFYWKKNGRNITRPGTKTYQLFGTWLHVVLVMELDYPKREDAGTYTVVASLANLDKSLDVNLIVEYIPEVNIIPNNGGSEYFLTGLEHKLNCSVKSVPFPSRVDWFEQKCESPIKCSIRNDLWKPVNDTDRTLAVYRKKVNFKLHEQQTYISQLVIKDTSVGSLKYYKCEGQNKVGTNSTSLRYVATDMKRGFQMWTLNMNPVVGETVKLYCNASIWKYSNLTVMNRSHDNQVDPGWDVNRTNITHIREKQSVITVVTISSITKYDRYSFVCFGTNASGSIQREINFKIGDSIPPMFTSGHSRRIYKDNSFAYDCEVSGRPKPVISWFKDFEKFDPQKMTEGFDIVREGQRLNINATNSSFSGIYTCEAENRGGIIARNFTFKYTKLTNRVPALTSLETTIIIVCCFVVAALVVALVALFCVNRKKSKNLYTEIQYLLHQKGEYNPDLPIDEQTSCISYDAKWEFPKERLRLGMVLGHGNFGRVVKAEAIGIVACVDVLNVAVKMVKDCTDRQQMMTLLSELKILIHIGQHLNILNLLGAVTKTMARGELFVIVEYCHFGSLRDYILKHKHEFQETLNDPVSQKMKEADVHVTEEYPVILVGDTEINKPQTTTKKLYNMNKATPDNTGTLVGPPLTKTNMISWSFQVARGMEYLGSKKYIHRDLAARNVLLADDNVVKICDFGLSKDCYKCVNGEYMKKGSDPEPVKWMAVESLTHKVYTTKSDVWSYGIFLWEVFALGGVPYPGIGLNKIARMIQDGYRMEQPAHASDDIYNVMLACWRSDPKERPTFTNLVNIMGEFLGDNVKQHYLDLDRNFDGDDEQSAEGATGFEPGYVTMKSMAIEEPTDCTKMYSAPLQCPKLLSYGHNEIY